MSGANGDIRIKAEAKKRSMECSKDRGPYDDIIELSRPVSTVHPAMPVADRAAQFMPFAALTGFEDAIGETGRLTHERMELEEDVIEGLDGKLQYLKERIGDHPEISVTYFKPDTRKPGGSYGTDTGRVKKIDLYEHILVMEDSTEIPMKEVVDIEGDVFSDLDR